MTVVDIGANIGLYTLFLLELAGKNGKVVSFEPDPLLFASLERNVRMNGHEKRAHLHQTALGSESGKLTLTRGPLNSGDNRLSSQAGEKVEVPVVRFDDVIDGAEVALIKMDVQGWEMHVLRGMGATLRDNPSLTLYFEFWPNGLRKAGSDPFELASLLTSSSYRLFDTSGGEPLSQSALTQLVSRLGRNGYTDLVARKA